MKMSSEGRKRLTTREGIRTKAYLDTEGVWTIGIGHTSAAGAPKVTKGLVLTAAEVDEVFARDLVQYEKAVEDAIKVPLAQHQFDALVSICFNIGTGGFKGSTMVRRINAKDTPANIRAAILMWNKPAVIIGRRTSEADQFQTPYTASQKTDLPGSPQTATKPSVGPTVTKTPEASPGASSVKTEGWLLKILKGLF